MVGSIIGLLMLAQSSVPETSPPREPLVNTFSIVAYDPETQQWGVAVASKYLAVGAVVPWAKADVGAIATQSYANVAYGLDGLELLKTKSAAETMKQLTDADKSRDLRQVGIVDAKGETATYTGEKCNAWAGGKMGKHYTCQGNLLAGPEVVDAMASTFESTKGSLAWRMMAALAAGEEKGGDKRGKQSAAILIVAPKRGPGGLNDRYIDFRVDDHADPIPELARILELKLPKGK